MEPVTDERGNVRLTDASPDGSSVEDMLSDSVIICLRKSSEDVPVEWLTAGSWETRQQYLATTSESYQEMRGTRNKRQPRMPQEARQSKND